MGNTSFILASIGVFLVVILLLVIILLVAKKYLSPSGNVNIVINGDKTINVVFFMHFPGFLWFLSKTLAQNPAL